MKHVSNTLMNNVFACNLVIHITDLEHVKTLLILAKN